MGRSAQRRAGFWRLSSSTSPWAAQLPPPLPEAYAGWNVPIGGANTAPIVKPGNASTYPFAVTAAAPTFATNLNPSELKGVLITPDYRYRLDYLSPVRGGQTTVANVPQVPGRGRDGVAVGASIRRRRRRADRRR